MKKLPKSVTIFGRKIPIRNIPGKKILELYPNYHQAPHGLWDSGKRVIIINSELELKDQRYVLFHEMGHAVNTFNGVELIIGSELQEILVQSNATLIEDVLSQAQILK